MSKIDINDNNNAFDVAFMSCVIDKADNLAIIDSDSHFCEFTGVHQSKIKQRKLSLLDILPPKDREDIMQQLCKKNSPYVYLDFYIIDKKKNFIYVYCIAHNDEDSTLCRLTLADVSRSIEKSKKLEEQAQEFHHLIDLVEGGVCLFKVNSDMHFVPLYINEACCKFFGTTKENYKKQVYRLDELIHPDDRSLVFQAIGNCMATKKPIDLEIRVHNHKDNYIWCKMNSAIQRYDSDNLPIFHAVFTNIANVKADEEAADRQSDIMFELFKSLPGALFCADLETPFKLQVVTEDFMKLTGYSRKELFEKYNGDLTNLMLDREVVMATHAIQSQAEKGNIAKATYSIRTKSGKYLIVIDRRKIVDSKHGSKSTTGLLRDITAMHLDEGFDF